MIVGYVASVVSVVGFVYIVVRWYREWRAEAR